MQELSGKFKSIIIFCESEESVEKHSESMYDLVIGKYIHSITSKSEILPQTIQIVIQDLQNNQNESLRQSI